MTEKYHVGQEPPVNQKKIYDRKHFHIQFVPFRFCTLRHRVYVHILIYGKYSF